MPASRQTHRNRRSSPALPAYHLYGEQGSILPDRLHGESIAERSRLHGWEIRPHRHETLFQFLLVRRGMAQALLEGHLVPLRGPALVTVPGLAVHGFHFAPDIDGHVLTVDEQHLQALLQPHGALAAAVLRLQALPLSSGAAHGVSTAARRELLAAVVALLAEVEGHAAWRTAALDAALLRLCVAVARVSPAVRPDSTAAAPPPQALRHVQRLRTLVEQQYRQQPTQAALAAQIGITPTHLNRACHQVLGHPAQAVLHGRLLLQAQRELAYSSLSIKQIALELGFSDAAYFTRFFRRQAGQSPAQWRAARLNAPAAHPSAQV